MTVTDRMNEKLTAGLSPLHLSIVDDSHKHEGHSGWREGGQTHFRVEIVSEQFSGKSRVERQRMVYALLADELAETVHALQLKTLAPSEYTRR
ncbi:BolA family protein [Denitrobaculum tricleocarpae]|uniref:BolA family transcriptional regulator n=1 Tax=Denitrobaculum tricleocarpae TaxID=2591009 RepID=A0A545T7U8_9PROT|nr:BolA family protein [Denitrobaculum tricleocarpae]TQV73290.1 BolA family transcriptional regulator [Denitrobaculum tricleocarpae]